MTPPSSDTHFDAVIVGSGFGGSTMAYRLAEAGLRVCLLERGKAYPPGSFPRSPAGLQRNFWDPSEGFYGMFQLWSFVGLEGLVSSGLGGGSLIYANVLLRKDERWFASERDGRVVPWPVTRAELEPHYDRCERMLGAQLYPFERSDHYRTRKTRALKDAAERTGRQWSLVPLAVTFANPDEEPVPGTPIREAYPNLHGRTRVTCQLCGECDIGCNYGSKNTLDYNYLSEAKRLGADVRTLCEVRTLAPRAGGGYGVGYVQHDAGRYEGQPRDTGGMPLLELTCDQLVLSAGTFGSTYLLLRNRKAFPGLSKTLGSRFCGNGDLLTFATACRDEGGARGPRRIDPSDGPVITSAVRIPDALDGDGATGRGFYVEDAGVPAFLLWLFETTGVGSSAKRIGRFAWHRLRAFLGSPSPTNLSAEVAKLLGPGDRSACSVPMLGMGRDVPDGRMFLREDGLLENDWSTRGSREYFERVRDTMRSFTEAWGGRFHDNPLWWMRRVVTVHPLGGNPMAESDAFGVVDPWGEAFNHPGLFVADGSVMPGPVGANPSLTIAALADRFADRLLENARRRIGARTVASDADYPGVADARAARGTT